eukprot:CAMPEP_0172926402 /NCGR_PEP_ID=MMETSP1075-20121228/215518_1 /TAXON_ID=2916 /ORGANISM="Ceratium fusus, Strain PA161109" /LENGTH=389 /DNA_ID=CAMNT_0013787457 /DNA_START=96 /DNA_END=1262 /DNA_ORIENTATION=-
MSATRNLGAVLGQQQRYSEAADVHLLELRFAESAEAAGIAGKHLMRAERLAEAEAAFRVALKFEGPRFGLHCYRLCTRSKLACSQDSQCDRFVYAGPEGLNALGYILRQQDRLDEAQLFLKQVLELLPSDRQALSNLAMALQFSDQAAEFDALTADAVRAGIWRHRHERPIHLNTELPMRSWYTVGDSPLLREASVRLSDSFQKIFQEYQVLESQLPSEIVLQNEGLAKPNSWKVIWIKRAGSMEGCRSTIAPNTCNALRSFPLQIDSARFSIMAPRARVRPHCGQSNELVNLHLALRMGAASAIRVGDETRTWEEGRVLMFNDAFEHELWNNGYDDRVILLVRVHQSKLPQQQQNQLPPNNQRPSLQGDINTRTNIASLGKQRQHQEL